MADKDICTVRIVIGGRVQGVGFRFWTERVAGELGISGWVRNRRDGKVEALLSGPQDKLNEMLQRCNQGPRSARVDSVRVVGEGGTAREGFGVLPTV